MVVQEKLNSVTKLLCDEVGHKLSVTNFLAKNIIVTLGCSVVESDGNITSSGATAVFVLDHIQDVMEDKNGNNL